MKVRNVEFKGRKGWELDNDVIRLVMLQGGGHIASLTHIAQPGINPLWEPVWKTKDPWAYKAAMAGKYQSRQLAAICGHNLCLGWFGMPSDEEAAAGMECHGEAGIVRWKLLSKKAGTGSVSFKCGCELPASRMRVERTITADRFANMIHVKDAVYSLARVDVPFTMAQHVTFGAPFLKKGVTVFDMPATRCHTFPGDFGGKLQRLKTDRAFVWPKGPGARGETVDMRIISPKYRASSDFSAQLMNPRQRHAWFSVLNPEAGLLVAYVWDRSDYPWVGNWEENFGRASMPWAGKSLARGMEFANTPFPGPLRNQVDTGRFQAVRTYRWLPAKSSVVTEYDIVIAPVVGRVKGVLDISREGGGLDVALRV